MRDHCVALCNRLRLPYPCPPHRTYIPASHGSQCPPRRPAGRLQRRHALLLMGSALGALAASVFHAADPGLWAMIGMAALMGGTMQIPLTAIVFALELTGDVAALPALLIACVASAAVTVLLMRRSILTEKLARRGRHLTREYGINPLQVLRVEDVMEPPIPSRPAAAWWATWSAPRSSPRGCRSRATSIRESRAGSGGCAKRRASGCPRRWPLPGRCACTSGTSSSCRAASA